MSKKNKKPEAKKEEPKKPETPKMPWWGPYAGVAIILMIIHSILHPNGTTAVPSPSSAPAPGPTVVRVEKLIWLPNDLGQKELYPIIYENGQEVVLRNDRLKGGRVTTQTSNLLSPTSSDYRYTVP